MTKSTQVNIPKKLLIYLLLLTFLLIVVHLVLQYINLNLFNEKNGSIYELTNRFDLDDEVSVPTWVSQIMLFVLAVASGLAAKLADQKNEKQLWALFAFAGLTGSIDEGAGLHELVLQTSHNMFFTDQAPTVLANAWWLLLPFIIFAVIWFLWRASKEFNKQTLVLFAIGLGMYFSGAALIDLASNIQTDSLFFKQGVLVAIEEGLELAGASVLIYTVAQYLYMFRRQPLQIAWNAIKYKRDRLEPTNDKTSNKKNSA